MPEAQALPTAQLRISREEARSVGVGVGEKLACGMVWEWWVGVGVGVGEGEKGEEGVCGEGEGGGEGNQTLPTNWKLVWGLGLPLQSEQNDDVSKTKIVGRQGRTT